MGAWPSMLEQKHSDHELWTEISPWLICQGGDFFVILALEDDIYGSITEDDLKILDYHRWEQKCLLG